MARHLALALAGTLFATACAPGQASSSLTAVATVYPLTWLVEQIAPDAEVTSLAAQGQDPHDQELSPQQRALLEQADLVAYVGQIGFQPQVERAVGGAAGAVVSVADVVGPEALRPLENGHDDDAHDDEEAVDPHFWFDARLMASVALEVGDAAARADAANAAAYRESARRVSAELESVAAEIQDLLRSCRHDSVVVGHEAYGYLVEPHGLEQHGISGAAGHSEASPADIGELVTEIREQQLPAVLTEPVEGRADAEVVAREAGVELIDIFSLDIVDDEQAAKGFVELLTEQAQAVARAAECGT